MKATKIQIVKGIIAYAESELIPKMWDRSSQFIAASAVNLLKRNPALAETVFEHPILKMILVPDDRGMCDVDALFGALEDTFKQYREFPIPLPQIPFSKSENSFTFKVDDLDEIKKRIGLECGYGPQEDQR